MIHYRNSAPVAMAHESDSKYWRCFKCSCQTDS